MAQQRTDGWHRKPTRRPADPVEAKQIAEHTVMALADIRHCTSLDDLMARYRAWEAYADGMSVVSQIRDHVRSAVSETAITIKARRIVRDPTGEAA